MNLDKNPLLSKIKNAEQPKTGWNKTEQFLHENATWKRVLSYFIQENNFLKNKLSVVVDRETDKLFIAHAEQFQNEFILKDECMLDIGNDIKRQENDLQQASEQIAAPDHKTCKMQKKLRNEMSNLEKECSNLKIQFNKYLLSIE
ncbi:MAG: hypothetical protein ABI707_07230 [Ferruginibacter sp.]